MASQTLKRVRPTSRSNTKSIKRQKIVTGQNSATRIVKKKQVALDTLPWKQVQMLGSLENAEGFFGLEEVDGVEVLREGKILKFITSEKNYEDAEDEFEGFGEDKTTCEDTNSECRSSKTAEPHAKRVGKQNTKEKSRRGSEYKESNISVKNGCRGDMFEALSEVDTGETDVSAWVGLGLSSSLLIAISKLGFSKPTPIQSSAIQEILAGHDVVGKASTGSGKTLAFAIPIVESWLESNEDLDRRTSATALILSPTRELAHQLTEHISTLCNGLPDAPQVVTITGGLSVQKQQRQLAKADIIIGTPGRLWEVMSSSQDTLENIIPVKYLVIDEADRLLAEGHFKEVEQILDSLDYSHPDTDDNEQTSSNRQTLVFSATFQKDLQQKLAGKSKTIRYTDDDSMEYLLKKLKFRKDEPKFVDVNPISQMAENLKEGIVECSGIEKDLYLYALLLLLPNKRTLIFTNSIHSVRRLTPMLENLNLKTQAIHSKMAQRARMRSIERFSSRNSESPILVATDVAARGLDIKDIELVIHYHLPRSADMYVHRSGRTARAEAKGLSILMCSPEEVVGMRRLVAKVHARNAIAGNESNSKYYMKSLDLNRKLVARLKPRLLLAKQIADSTLAKQKKGHDNEWLKAAAEELGVDYNSDEFEATVGESKGRGTGRRLKEKEARAITKNEMYSLKEELKTLLSQRVNVGVSERYLTSGNMNINDILLGTRGDFLGAVDDIFTEDF